MIDQDFLKSTGIDKAASLFNAEIQKKGFQLHSTRYTLYSGKLCYNIVFTLNSVGSDDVLALLCINLIHLHKNNTYLKVSGFDRFEEPILSRIMISNIITDTGVQNAVYKRLIKMLG